jgi:hypothetical protein
MYESGQHLTLLIRTIVESKGNARGLIDPVLCAISAVMLAYPAWLETGLRWIEAFDEIYLMKMHDIVRPLKPAEPARSTIAGMLVQRLTHYSARRRSSRPRKSTNQKSQPMAPASR